MFFGEFAKRVERLTTVGGCVHRLKLNAELVASFVVHGKAPMITDELGRLL